MNPSSETLYLLQMVDQAWPWHVRKDIRNEHEEARTEDHA